jgi:hypothetical protein
MFCDAYHKSLTEAAVAGGELTPALQQHLSVCESCCNAFAEEQSLFAAMDAALLATANAEVPATLIPRVHVALNNEAIPQSRNVNFLWGFAGATVTAVVVLALLYFPFKRPTTRTTIPVKTSPATTAKSSPDDPALNPVRGSGVSSVQHKQSVVLVASHGSTPELPEVIVPPEEGTALLRYEEFIRRKQVGVALMATAKSLDLPQGIEPLQIGEIELVDLSIPALSKWESDDDTK